MATWENPSATTSEAAKPTQFPPPPPPVPKRMPKSVLGSSTESGTRGILCHAWKRKAMGRAPGGHWQQFTMTPLKRSLGMALFREWSPSMDLGFENVFFM